MLYVSIKYPNALQKRACTTNEQKYVEIFAV